MTPKGSFQGSKRLTWVTSGRFVSTPIHLSRRLATRSSSSKFLGLSGSMAGGVISTRSTGTAGGAKLPSVKIAASESSGQGLRVVYHNEVVLFLEQLRVAGRVSEVGLLFCGRQFAWGSLQAIVDRLCYQEEGLIPCDQLPVGQEAQVAQEGYLGAEDLGDSAAVGGCVDVENPCSL